MNRNFEGASALDKSSGLQYIEKFNPRLLSNNFLLPYVVAIWEDYFRSTFAAVLKYSGQREGILKKARLSHTQLDQIAPGAQPIERAVSECFSFQRPSLISENFRIMDSKLDFGGAMKKLYRRRKVSLYDSIEALVEGRNAFVHEGEMDMTLFDKKMQIVLDDIVTAVDPAYECIGRQYKFVPLHDY